MASHLYIFRITINSKERLSINIEEPDGSRQFSANFGYSDELVQAITAFQQEARQKNPMALTGADVRQLGEQLFQAIFDKQLQSEFEKLYEKVKKADDLLRIELDIDEEYLPQVAAFPWEFMRPMTGTAVLLSASPHLILSRRPRFHLRAPSLELNQGDKIRILLVASYPGTRQDAELGPVLYQPIHNALRKLADDPNSPIELFFTDNAQARELNALLKAHKPHVFHFIGHGRLHKEDQDSEERGQLALAPEDDLFGKGEWVDAGYFSRLFSENHPAPSLVLLQACEGARLSDSYAFASVASRVVQQNIPAVVGMQYIVSNDTAVEFAEAFYRELAQDAPIDVAVQAGRQAITQRDLRDEGRDFATPVLFMRLADGRLFQRKQLAIQTTRRRGAPDNNLELRRALTRLNFHDHRRKFGDIYGKAHKRGAFLISGPESSGHQWVQNLLLKEELGNSSDIDPIPVNIGTEVFTQSIDELWNYFAYYLTNKRSFSLPEMDIAKLFLERWQAGHTVIVLNDVCKRSSDYPKSVIDMFWQPLTLALQAVLKQENKAAPNHWFLLFLLDTQGKLANKLADWNADQIDRSDPVNPIILELDSHFKQNELDTWWEHGHTRFALKPALSRPQFDTIEKLRKFVWHNSGNGQVQPLFTWVCRVCDADWDKIEGS